MLAHEAEVRLVEPGTRSALAPSPAVLLEVDDHHETPTHTALVVAVHPVVQVEPGTPTEHSRVGKKEVGRKRKGRHFRPMEKRLLERESRQGESARALARR